MTRSALVNPTPSLAAREIGRLGDTWLLMLAWCLVGYALLGKGFAYIGVRPIFIGELLMLVAVAAFAFNRRWRRILDEPVVWFMLVWMGWGAARTVPYLGFYGISALRDAVTWGYALLALVLMATVIEDPARLRRLLEWFGRFAPFAVLLIPPLWFLSQYLASHLPTLPWASDVTVVYIKNGDSLVLLAGVFVFWVCGFGVAAWWQVVEVAAAIGVIGATNRAGMVAFALAAGSAFMMRPRAVVVRQLVTVAVVAMVLLLATNVTLPPPPDHDRPVSARQLMLNVTSIFSDKTHNAGEVQGTKEWRLEWWSDIVHYTVMGRYFWTGKGFGVNLATDDGFQADPVDSSLRSPHNIHMTMLARMGVPGLVMWVVMQGGWVWLIARSFVRARRRGDDAWSKVFLLAGAFWLAFIVNASFDVYLEGPMGGIWFWSLIGFGLSAAWCYRHAPWALDEADAPAAEA